MKNHKIKIMERNAKETSFKRFFTIKYLKPFFRYFRFGLNLERKYENENI